MPWWEPLAANGAGRAAAKDAIAQLMTSSTANSLSKTSTHLGTAAEAISRSHKRPFRVLWEAQMALDRARPLSPPRALRGSSPPIHRRGHIHSTSRISIMEWALRRKNNQKEANDAIAAFDGDHFARAEVDFLAQELSQSYCINSSVSSIQDGLVNALVQLGHCHSSAAFGGSNTAHLATVALLGQPGGLAFRVPLHDIIKDEDLKENYSDDADARVLARVRDAMTELAAAVAIGAYSYPSSISNTATGSEKNHTEEDGEDRTFLANAIAWACADAAQRLSTAASSKQPSNCSNSNSTIMSFVDDARADSPLALPVAISAGVVGACARRQDWPDDLLGNVVCETILPSILRIALDHRRAGVASTVPDGSDKLATADENAIVSAVTQATAAVVCSCLHHNRASATAAYDIHLAEHLVRRTTAWMERAASVQKQQQRSRRPLLSSSAATAVHSALLAVAGRGRRADAEVVAAVRARLDPPWSVGGIIQAVGRVFIRQ